MTSLSASLLSIRKVRRGLDLRSDCAGERLLYSSWLPVDLNSDETGLGFASRSLFSKTSFDKLR